MQILECRADSETVTARSVYLDMPGQFVSTDASEMDLWSHMNVSNLL